MDTKEYQRAYRVAHKEKSLEYARVYRTVHKEEIAKKQRVYDLSRRLKVLEHYGGKCACCGEARYEFLAIDHMGGGGTEHRKNIGRGANFTQWLIRNDYPEGFRVLCHNCNMAIGFYGHCPHQEKQAE